MAIKDTTSGVNYGKKEYQCTSADISALPTDIADGSTCYVVDTKKVMIMHDGTWNEM